VFGQSFGTTGRGVTGWAYSATGSNFGVYGHSTSSDGTGVLGVVTASTGGTVGVQGRTASPTGIGVNGSATAPSGTAVGLYGHAVSPDGRALLADGRAEVTGPLRVAGRTTVTRVDAARLVARSSSVAAVDARSTASRGAVLDGKVAPLRLLPRSARPSKGSSGDLFVDDQNRLWFCKGGTAWKQLA
jgi:hypothetical protein